MKKKLFLIALCAVAAGSMLEARRGHGRHGHRGWRRGYGYGPGIGVGLTVPLGGGSRGPKRPAAAKQFKRENGYYPSSAREFCQWAKGYFTPDKAKRECRRYENYQDAPRTYSRPSGYLSFGVGGGGYGGYGYPYGGYYGGYRRGWW